MTFWTTMALAMLFVITILITMSVQKALKFLKNPDPKHPAFQYLTRLKYEKWGWMYTDVKTWLKVKDEMNKNQQGVVLNEARKL